MKAIILAAGKGTRLRPVTLTMPKPLVPVANKPLIEYSIGVLKNAGLTDIGIVVDDLNSPVVQQLSSGTKLGVKLQYIVQAQQLGLAHAVSLCKDFIGDESFGMFLGDNIYQDSLLQFFKNFDDSDAEAALALGEVPDPTRFGIAEVQKGAVTRVVEKPKNPPSNLAISGVYLFRQSIWEAIANIEPSARNELEITDAIQWLISQGKKVQSYIVQGWWMDAGKPDAIMRANQFVLGDLPYSPPIEDSGRVLGKTEVTSRVLLGENSQIIDSVVRGPVIIGNNVLIKNSYIGPYTSIGDNVRIVNSEIEASIVMKNCVIDSIPGRIDSSLLADNSQVTSSTQRLPAAHRFVLAEDSYVQL